jgi:hypothetical protein
VDLGQQEDVSQRKPRIDEGPANNFSVAFGNATSAHGVVPTRGNFFFHIADNLGRFVFLDQEARML